MSAVFETRDFAVACDLDAARRPSARWRGAKWAHTTRRVDVESVAGIVTDREPRSGDLVLASVERVGQHGGLQLASGRRATLFAGDEIVVVYADRYAPDQFEAEIPSTLEPCHLVAGGGVAARVLRSHSRMRSPTAITPIGLLADSAGQVLNLDRFGLPPVAPRVAAAGPLTIAVVGTSMNAGKTTTCAHLVRGLVRAGLRVAAGKLTGTGAGGDSWLMYDAGASPVLDFTDVGFASTFRQPLERLVPGVLRLMDALTQSDVDVVVMEIADGLYQRETAALLSDPSVAARIDGLLFAAQDAMGAAMGTEWLERRGLPVVGVTGTLTAAPLAVREAEEATRLPVLSLATLGDAAAASELLLSVRSMRSAS